MSDSHTLTVREATFLIVAVVATLAGVVLTALRDIAIAVDAPSAAVWDIWLYTAICIAMAVLSVAAVVKARTGAYPFEPTYRRLAGGGSDG